MNEDEASWNLAILVCAMSITASLHKMQQSIFDCIRSINSATTRFYSNF